MARDLLPQNVQDRWYALPAQIKSVLGYPDIDFDNLWICFNIQNTSDIVFPKNASKVVITYHTEYIKHIDLLEFFKLHPETQFLFLSDCEQAEDGIPWPQNVTSSKWLTWHHQLDTILAEHGIQSVVRKPSRKISCLSFHHEFHKAAVTAYLLQTFAADDMIISWWNTQVKSRLYYKSPEYYLPPHIAAHVLAEDFQKIVSIALDPFDNNPLANSQWSHPAYLDCLFNCTNESVYNDFCMIDNYNCKLPWPYLTEKTWKPLLAGRPFVPVSQSRSLAALAALGLQFMPLLMEIDLISSEFERITAIWSMIDHINRTSLDDLFDMTLSTAEHNLGWISQGNFQKQCDINNALTAHKIQSWINA